MNQIEYKGIKEQLTWLEQNTSDHKWYSGRFNVMSWTLPHLERYARTDAGERRCAEAIERFERIKEIRMLDFKQIGPRAKQTREQANLTLDQAAAALAMPAVTAQDLARFEQEGAPLSAVVLIKLACNVYKCQLATLLHGPYPYQTEQEWIQAYLRAEVSEGILADGLKIDRLEARDRVRLYEEQTGVA